MSAENVREFFFRGVHAPSRGVFSALAENRRVLPPTAGPPESGAFFLLKRIARAGGAGYLFLMKHTFTAILTREDGGFVALCPELDVVSQGATVEEAKANLQEAVELFFECASETEIRQRVASESFISTMEVQVA